MHPFALAFLAVLGAVTATRWWLSRRQLRHLATSRDSVPAPFVDWILPQAQQRTADYAAARLRTGWAEQSAQAFLLIVLTVGGGVQVLAETWRDPALHPLVAGTGLLLSVAAVRGLLAVPFSAYRTFAIEARFGFNRTTPALFLTDLLRGILVAAALLIPLSVAVLALMAGTGALWWLYAWGIWVLFSVALTWAGPKWIAPLFNRFRPLAEEELYRRIGHLLESCGFTLKAVLVMDASRRTAHGNAYFTGLGPAKRVVLFDTLLESLGPPEAEAVLAHELGHYRLGHIRRGVAASAIAALGVLGLLAWLRGQEWFFHGLGMAGPSDAGALALLLLVAPVFGFALRPLVAAWSRRREREADAFAASHGKAPALARALAKLYRDNAMPLTSDPAYALVYYSHPVPAERVRWLTGAASG